MEGGSAPTVQRKLTLETIHRMNGGVYGQTVQEELMRAMLDCENRPSIDKPRSVKIEIVLKPDKSREGDGVEMKLKIGSATLPSEESRSHFMDLVVSTHPYNGRQAEAIFFEKPTTPDMFEKKAAEQSAAEEE